MPEKCPYCASTPDEEPTARERHHSVAFMRQYMSDQEIRKWIAKTYLSSDSVQEQDAGYALLAMLKANR